MELTKEDQLYLQIISDLHENWTPHTGQLNAGKALINALVDTLFIQCGRKWGKTDFALYLIWRWALLHPGSTCYYIAPEMSHGRELIWSNNRLINFGKERDSDGRFVPGGNDSLAKYIKHRSNTESRLTLRNGSQIKIIGSENWAAANGLTPDFVVYDEFKIFHGTFHTEMNPNRLVRRAPLVIIGTPPKVGDRNMDQYLEYSEECYKRDDAYKIVAKSEDNPHLPEGLLAIEKEKLFARGESDVWYREYEAKIVPGGRNAIFPMLSQTRHVSDAGKLYNSIRRDLHKLDWFCVTDPGTTTCFAALIGCINPYTRKITILKEVYEKDQENTSTRRIYPKLDALMMQVYPDSDPLDDWVKIYDEAAAWFATEVMSQYGIYFSPTMKHLSKKEHGLSLVKDVLLHDMIEISSECKNLIWEMESYAKDSKGNIPKRNDHLIDCLRYLLSAANYSMVEVMEIIKGKNDESRRFATLDDDMNEYRDEKDWTRSLMPRGEE